MRRCRSVAGFLLEPGLRPGGRYAGSPSIAAATACKRRPPVCRVTGWRVLVRQIQDQQRLRPAAICDSADACSSSGAVGVTAFSR